MERYLGPLQRRNDTSGGVVLLASTASRQYMCAVRVEGHVDVAHLLEDILWAREGYTKKEYDSLMMVYTLFDRDNSGEISASELTSIMNYLGYSIDKAVARPCSDPQSGPRPTRIRLRIDPSPTRNRTEIDAGRPESDPNGSTPH